MGFDKPNLPKSNIDNAYVIRGHDTCQSNKAKWLCLENIYQKFHRSNMYDIGSTYIQDVPDFQFTFQTQQVGLTFLLHIYAGNTQEGIYNIGLSNGNEFTVNKKTDIAYLSHIDIKYNSYNVEETRCPIYLHTYSFQELDIEFLKGKKLYIAIRLKNTFLTEEVENVKALHDCRELLADPVGSDFVIVAEDGYTFNVHKILLITHSEVFKAMLKDDTAESQNGVVCLMGVETEDIRAMIEYIYTGTIDHIEDVNLNNMLMLSDRYNLRGMRELCNHALTQQLSIENAMDILLMADMYDSETLKIKALKFIKSNREALKSSTFQEINNVSLMRELCDYVAS